jgi:BirA family biotin operon repressor/biotin-[acetyl-CoA-carboxylase] ligase
MSRAGFTDVRRFAELDSTNSYLLEEAALGAPEGVVAVADHQRAGRGRLGRRWEAPPGGCLLVSVLLRPALPPERLFVGGALVALAAADAADRVAGVAPELKWPNDLVIGGRKVAGVLAEARSAPGTGPALVVGLGLNVTWPGPDPATTTSLSAAAGRPVDRESVLEVLLDRLAERRPALDQPDGPDDLVAELARRCATVGQAVRVELSAGSFEGRAVGLTGSGHLVVDTAGVRREVAAGDVVHLRPAAPASPGRPSDGH